MLVETYEIEEIYEGVDKSECDEATMGLIESDVASQPDGGQPMTTAEVN